MISFRLCDDIYAFEWLICFGGTQLEAFGEFSKTFNPNISDGIIGSDSMVACVYRHEDINAGCIWFGDKTDIGVISHEVFHATIFALQERGVDPPKSFEDEHYAYYNQWLFQEIFNLYRKWRKVSN